MLMSVLSVSRGHTGAKQAVLRLRRAVSRPRQAELRPAGAELRLAKAVPGLAGAVLRPGREGRCPEWRRAHPVHQGASLPYYRVQSAFVWT